MNQIKIILLLFVLAFVLSTPGVYAQENQIKGMVVSINNGQPLEGISVKLKHIASDPVLTDSLGRFSLEVENTHSMLEFEYPGYKTQTYLARKGESIIVQMMEQGYYWYEDQVNNYSGTQSKKYSIGAISHIDKHMLDQNIASSIESKLIGQAAGVQVTPLSGSPGSGSSVNIRGVASIQGGNQPLYIVDGMYLRNLAFDNPLSIRTHHNPIASLNPDDIESVTILKDGLSTAQYGVRGSNGVVLIKTKKGTSGETRLSFDAFVGLSSMDRQYEMLDKNQFKTYYKDLRYRSGMTTDEFADTYGRYFYEDRNSPYYYRYSNNTNWQDEVTQLGMTSNYHLNLQGGDQVTTYAFSVGYYTQEGIVKATDFNRFTLDFNLIYRVSPKVRFGNVVNFATSTKNNQDEGLLPYSNPLYSGLIKTPMISSNMYSEDGVKLVTLEDTDFFNMSNPTAITNNLSNEASFTRFIGNVFLELDLHKDVTSKLSLAIDYDRQTERRFYPQYGVISTTNAERYSEGKINNRFMIQGGAHTYFDKVINDAHQIKWTGGVEFINQTYDFTYGKAINSPADYFLTLAKGTADSIAGDDKGSLLASALTSLDYTYRDKYMLSANTRLDGSSKFSKDNRYGLFYGVGAAWRISAEPFMSGVGFINDLKLKVGYGKTGNENINDYAAYNLYSGVGADYNERGAMRPVRIGNPDLKWETTNQIDLGLELLAWRGRLGIEIDVYAKQTSDLFYFKALPSYASAEPILSNLGDVENIGGDLSIMARFVERQNFKWTSWFNVAAYKNEVTRLPDGDVLEGYAGYMGLAREGQPIGMIYGYETAGIYDSYEEVVLDNGEGYSAFQPGDVKFVDHRQDGIINPDDQVVIGDPHPDFFGSWNNNFKYKNWTLDLNFTYSYGNEVANVTRSVLESMSGDFNQTTAVLKAWQKLGDASITTMPRLAYGDPSGNNRPSDRFIEDASYIRLQSATLAYDLKQEWLAKTFIKSVNLYFRGQNLYTISKYLGYQPDVATLYSPLLSGIDTGAYPIPQSFFVGVKIGL